MSDLEPIQSGIAGVSEIRRLPRLGKIRLGVKKEGRSGSYPQAVDYFVCPDEVKAVYGDTPRELAIMFPGEDLDLVAPQFMKCYSYSLGIICKGNGRVCNRKVDSKTGDFAGKNTEEWVWANSACEPAHCPKVGAKQCRRVMSLFFILPDVPGLGVYQLDTSSWHSIVNINSQLAPASGMQPGGFLRTFTGGRIAYIPLVLEVIHQEVNPPGQGRKEVNVLHVRAQVKLADIIRIARQRPAQVLLPSADDDSEEPYDSGVDEMPKDLFPPKVLQETTEEHPEAKMRRRKIPMDDDAQPRHILSQEEIETLVTPILKDNPEKAEDQAMACIRWAERARLDGIILNLVTEGLVLVKGMYDSGLPVLELAPDLTIVDEAGPTTQEIVEYLRLQRQQRKDDQEQKE